MIDSITIQGRLLFSFVIVMKANITVVKPKKTRQSEPIDHSEGSM